MTCKAVQWLNYISISIKFLGGRMPKINDSSTNTAVQWFSKLALRPRLKKTMVDSPHPLTVSTSPRRSTKASWRSFLAPLLFLSLLVAPIAVQAQSTLISNTGKTKTGLGDIYYAWYNGFTTGTYTYGYRLTSIKLNVTVQSGTTADYSLSIYDDSSGEPGSSLVTLDNPASLATGEVEFTVSSTDYPNGYELSANTTYYIVIVDTVGLDSELKLDGTSANAEDSGGFDGWSIADEAYLKDGESSAWEDPNAEYALQFAVVGNLVPSPPTAMITLPDMTEIQSGGTINMVEQQTLVLTGSGDDADGGDVTVTSWELKDSSDMDVDTTDATFIQGTDITERILSVSTAGTYKINLTVTDDESVQATDTFTVVVETNVAPTATIVPSGTLEHLRSTDLELDGSGSSSGNPGDSITYTWTATDTSDDDVTDAVLSNTDMPTATFNSDVTDTYVVKLIVEDSGLLIGTATVTVTTVISFPPTAQITTTIPVSLTEGQALSLSGSGSERADPNATITFAWTAVNSAGTDVTTDVFSNTSSANNATTTTFAAATADTYTVTLTATDNDSETGEATVTISVIDNHLPVVSITPSGSATVDAGKDLLLEGMATDADASDTIASYAWTVSDGTNQVTDVLSSTDAAETTFRSDTLGTYTVTLLATDSRGGEGMATVTVTVEHPLVISTMTVSIDEEGGLGSWTVALNSEPVGAVTVTLENSDESVAIVTPSSLSFDATNWSEAQTITVVALDDTEVNTPDRMATISHVISGEEFTSPPVATVVVTALDDDAPGIKLSETALSVIEGDLSGTWTVRLQSEPTGDVTVAVASTSDAGVIESLLSSDDDPDAVPKTASTSLTFTAQNWNQPQLVTVEVENDAFDNANDRTVAITHTASGGGYDNVAVASLSLTVVDDDVSGVAIDQTEITILEGGQGSYTISLGSQPVGGDVTVTGTITRTSGSDVRTLTVADATSFTQTFTATNWSDPQTVTLMATSDDTPKLVDTIYTVAHAVSGADYGNVTAESITITIPGFSVSGTENNIAATFLVPTSNMLRVPNDGNLPDEIAGAILEFESGVTSTSQVILSQTPLNPDVRPPDFEENVDVLVDISFKDGDTVEFSGQVKICLPRPDGGRLYRWNADAEPGEWWEELSVPDGDIPAGYACGIVDGFSLFATAPAPEVVVVPVDREVEVSRLAQLGRVMAGQVVDAVQDRLSAPLEAGFKANMAGYALPSFSDTTRLPSDVSSTQFGLGSGSAGLRDWQHTEVKALTEQSLLSGSSFSLTESSKGTDLASIWGQASAKSFDGQGLEDGQMMSGVVGADWASDKLTTGFVLSQSQGQGTWVSTVALEGQAPQIAREDFESSMTGIHPYFGYEFSNRMTVWGMAGYGQGDVESIAGGQMTSVDMDMLMFAGGTSGVLKSPAFMSDNTLISVDSDMLWVSMGSDAENSSVSRLRVAMAVSRLWLTSGEGELRPSAELGFRLDGGDAETGMGFDVGLGLEWRDPKSGISARLRGRGLLTHEDDSLRERGVSGSFGWDSRPGSAVGSNLTMSYSMGSASSGGAKALFSRDTLSAAQTIRDDLGNRRMEIRFGYGMLVLGGRFIGTPQTALGYSEDERDVSLGWQMTLTDRAAVRGTGSLGLSVEARRSESASDGYRPEDEIVFRLRTQF